jgi:hypothetical protein
MTSFKQIEANRRNAEHSTGPRSEAGKQRSSRNAFRHGLTAETVIEPLEDAEHYATFEEAIAASFDPETAVERELILRLANLLWRLRRATSIETALFQVKMGHNSGPQPASELSRSPPSHLVGIHVAPACIRPSDDVGVIPTNTLRTRTQENRIDLAWRFLRVINLTDDAFERLGRYEAALWRQVRQTLFSLEGLRLGCSAKRYRRSHYQKTLVTNSVQVRVKRPNRIRHKRGAALSSKAHLRCYLGSWSLVLL